MNELLQVILPFLLQMGGQAAGLNKPAEPSGSVTQESMATPEAQQVLQILMGMIGGGQQKYLKPSEQDQYEDKPNTEKVTKINEIDDQMAVHNAKLSQLRNEWNITNKKYTGAGGASRAAVDKKKAELQTEIDSIQGTVNTLIKQKREYTQQPDTIRTKVERPAGAEQKTDEFAVTPYETKGLESLMKLFEKPVTPIPETFKKGVSEVEKLATGTEYDPYSDTGLFGGLKRNIMREAEDANRLLTRESAITGGRYGSKILEEKGKLAERTTNKLADTLAGLYDSFSTRKAGAARDLANLGISEYDIARGGETDILRRVGASQEYGALPRTVAQEELAFDYGADQQARAERLGLLGGVLGYKPEYGVKSVPTYAQPTPWDKLIETMMMEMGKNLPTTLGLT